MVRGWGRSPPAYWQQQKVGIECTRTFISSSRRTKRLNSSSSPQKPLPTASSSRLCFSRASQISLYRFPCAMREHRSQGDTSQHERWHEFFIWKRHSVFLEAAKRNFCSRFLSSSLAEEEERAAGAKIFYVYIQPKHKHTQVEHSSLAGWQNKVVFHGSASLPLQRKPLWIFCALLLGCLTSRTELQNSEQNLDFPSSTRRPGPNLQQN